MDPSFRLSNPYLDYLSSIVVHFIVLDVILDALRPIYPPGPGLAQLPKAPHKNSKQDGILSVRTQDYAINLIKLNL